MSVHKRTDGRIGVLYRVNGEQKWEYFNPKKDPQAMNKAKARDNEIKGKKIKGEPIDAAPQKMHFGTLFKKYVANRELEGASKSYTQELKSLFNNTFRNLSCLNAHVDDMKPGNMEEFFSHYKDRSLATRNRYGGYLKACFRWGIKQGHTHNNPLASWTKNIKGEGKKQFKLTQKDVERIWMHAPDHLRWALDVEYNLGTRPGESELLSLRWDQINEDMSEISVYATKTQEPRQLPITPEFKEMLLARKAIAKTDYIIEYNGKRVKKISKSFRTACRKAKIPDTIVMYDLRHLWVTTQLNNGGDLGAVSYMAGHATIKHTVDTYYHPHEAARKKSISLIPSLRKNDAEEPLQKEEASQKASQSAQSSS
jgi:integrase